MAIDAGEDRDHGAGKIRANWCKCPKPAPCLQLCPARQRDYRVGGSTARSLQLETVRHARSPDTVGSSGPQKTYGARFDLVVSSNGD